MTPRKVFSGSSFGVYPNMDDLKNGSFPTREEITINKAQTT